ncbi:MAG TPA: hypothetical protein VF269_01445 [Rhodanobacteraceae bacterium]
MLLWAGAATAASGQLEVRRISPSGDHVTPSQEAVIQFDRAMVPLGHMGRKASSLPVTITPGPGCQWRRLNTSDLACRLPGQRHFRPARHYTITVGTVLKALDGSHLTAPLVAHFTARLPAIDWSEFRTWLSYMGLWHSPALRAVHACEWVGPPPCTHRREWYLPNARQGMLCVAAAPRSLPVIAQPLVGEVLAIDPRLPASVQQLRLTLSDTGRKIARVQWRVDGQPVRATSTDTANWPLVPGAHMASAWVWLSGRASPLRLNRSPLQVRGRPRARG